MPPIVGIRAGTRIIFVPKLLGVEVDRKEIVAGAWYTHPDHEGQVMQMEIVPSGTIFGWLHDFDPSDLGWRPNGQVITLGGSEDDALWLERLCWAWGGPTRTITFTINVPIGDPNRGSDVIDPIVNKLLSLVDLGLLGEDDWWVDE